MRTSLYISALFMHDAFAIESSKYGGYGRMLFFICAVFLIMDIFELLSRAGNK